MVGRPYEPPSAPHDARPRVIVLFRVYAATMAIVSAALVAFALVSQVSFAATLGIVGAAFILLYAVAAFVPFEPWGWTIGAFAIASGVLSFAFVFALPLMIYWLKPETKAAFRRL